MFKTFTETENDFAKLIVGGVVFVGAAVLTLWSAWECLNPARKAIVIVCLGLVFLAGMFSIFWSRKTVKSIKTKAVAYDNAREPGHWTAPRVLCFWLVGGSQPIVRYQDGVGFINCAMVIRNGSPFRQEITQVMITEVTLYEGDKVIFIDKEREYHEPIGSVAPGEEVAANFKLKVLGLPPGLRFARVQMLVKVSSKSEELGKRTHSRASDLFGLVSDPRPPEAGSVPGLAVLDDVVKVEGELPGGKPWKFEAPWRVVMNTLLTDLLKPNWELLVRTAFANALIKKAGHEVRHGHDALVKINDDDFTTIRAQLMARGFVHLGNAVNTRGADIVWQITEPGRQFHIQETIIRTSQNPSG